MLHYLATFVLVICCPAATLAVECIECDEKLMFNSSETLNTTRPKCTRQNKAGDLCLASLSIDFENENANASLSHFPDDAFTISNGNKMITTTTIIDLSKNRIVQTIYMTNANSTAVAEDISKAYNTMQKLKYEELRMKLNEHLHTPVSYVADLTCSDNKGQSVKCPNGFCQLTGTGTSTDDRKCVPQGKIANPSGIVLVLTDMDGLEPTAAIIYACNRAMCNGAETNTKVRELLKEYGLLSIKEQTGSTTSVTITTNQTMMHFLWFPLLTMSILLQIF